MARWGAGEDGRRGGAPGRTATHGGGGGTPGAEDDTKAEDGCSGGRTTGQRRVFKHDEVDEPGYVEMGTRLTWTSERRRLGSSVVHHILVLV